MISSEEWGKIEPEEKEEWSQCSHCEHGRALESKLDTICYCRSLDEIIDVMDYYKIDINKNACCNFEHE